MALGLALAAAPSAVAEFPYVGDGSAGQPATYRVTPPHHPSDYNDGNWHYATTPDPSPAALPNNNGKLSELCGLRGSALADVNVSFPSADFPPGSQCATIYAGKTVNTAWSQTTGRPDVGIAVLDSGIRWNDPGFMNDVRKKVRINQGELPLPQVANTPTDPSLAASCAGYNGFTAGSVGTSTAYDTNGDGVFNLADYACDPRINLHNGDRHGPAGTMTPEDLILAFGNCQLNPDHTLGSCTAGQHYDNDHNGFANDIAGWDFVDNKNNPFDDVQYSHGSGEARDSTAEAGSGDVGTCPNCMVLPLRVGESFIADVNRFAQAAIYATDNGIDVVQEALGTLNNSSLARDAIEYAYSHGTTVVASAADEAAEHHNQPGVLPDTFLVNSVTKYNAAITPSSQSYLQFNGCTNFTTKLVVAVESSTCSSDATGKGAGIVGLIYSAAENAQDAGVLSPATDCYRVNGQRCLITPNEVRQLAASGNINGTTSADQGGGVADGDTYAGNADNNHGQADDVNFATQPDATSCTPAPTPPCTDPNSSLVWSPEQDGGRVASPLAETHRYPARRGFDEFYGYGRLNAFNAAWAAENGKIPPEANITSPDWFARLDPGSSAIAIQGYAYARGTPYTCTLEVAPGGEPNNAPASATPPGDFHPVSTGSPFCDGTTQHTGAYTGRLGAIDVATLKGYFPPSNVGSFDGREPGLAGAQTSNGRPSTMPYAFTVRVVVTTHPTSGTQMSGMDRRQLFLHRDADTLNSHFPLDLRTDGASSPVLADLEGTNRNDLVVGTSDGVIHAYRPDGTEAPGWPVHTDPLPLHNEVAYSTAGGPVGASRYGAVLGSLAAGDLFHDGRIEIVADDVEGKIYAWDGQGNRVFAQQANPAFSGNPTTVPGHPEYSTIRNGTRNRIDHSLYMAPVLAHLDGNANGPLDIVAAGADRHVYAWTPDGNPVPGFPVLVVDGSKVSSVDPVTHNVVFNDAAAGAAAGSGDAEGGKIVDTPAVADITGTGKPSIIVGTNENYAQGNDGGFNAGNFDTSALQVLGQVPNPGGGGPLLAYANTRAYAIKPTGLPAGESATTPSQINDAYQPGWPFKVGTIYRSLLPDVGEGMTGPPVVGPVTCPSGGSGLKVGLLAVAGPAYILNGDATSCYGNDPSNGKPVALQSDFAAGTGKYDTPAVPAAGDASFGNIGGQVTFLSPATGVLRALDLAANEYQGGQDFLAAWNPNTGQFMPGWPSPVNDLQFLTGPTVGAIDQTNTVESAVEGTASQDLQAFGPTGAPTSPSWPKLTADWTIAYPELGSFGTLDTDASAHKDVVSITRYGSLTVYSTPASACSPSSWPRYHHDLANSGDYTRDAIPPGMPMSAAYAAGKLTFTAPGNDLMCGQATGYQMVTSDTPITPQSFASGQAVTGLPAPGAAGASESIALPPGLLRYVAIRATDGAGNVGRPAVVDLGPGGTGRAGTGSGAAGSAGSGSAGPGAGALLSGNGLGACLSSLPRSSVVHHHGRRLGRKVALTGRVLESGCVKHPIRSVSVSVAELVGHHRCRFVGANGRPGAPRPCSRPVYLRARIRRLGSTGASWSLPLPRRLPRGRYRAVVQSTDSAGNRERRAVAANVLVFHVGSN